jgi:hypothetical protein
MRVIGFRRIVGGLCALLLAIGGPAAAQVAAPNRVAPPRPAIRLLQDEDTKIYLFGTVHVFPATLRWRSPSLDRIIAEADELVMETPRNARSPSARSSIAIRSIANPAAPTPGSTTRSAAAIRTGSAVISGVRQAARRRSVTASPRR